VMVMEDSLPKEHPCGNCVWRGFSDDNVPGCFKYQKPVNKDCDEKREE
jgi:hypothetical protein